MVKKNQKNLQDIIDVVQQLRHPKKGCPWDIEQTSKTLSKYTLVAVSYTHLTLPTKA